MHTVSFLKGNRYMSSKRAIKIFINLSIFYLVLINCTTCYSAQSGECYKKFALSINVDDKYLVYSLHNRCDQDVTLITHLDVGGMGAKHYRSLNLFIIYPDDTVHILSFIDSTTRAESHMETIKSGKVYSDKIDLLEWEKNRNSEIHFQKDTYYEFILMFSDGDSVRTLEQLTKGGHFKDKIYRIGTTISKRIKVFFNGREFNLNKS